jgi:enediyne biosynthesis protein E4
MGARVFDYNNDGRLDLFIVDMHSDMWMGPDIQHASLGMALAAEKQKFSSLYGPSASQNPILLRQEQALAQAVGFRLEEVLFGNAFWRNEGKGKFTEVSDQANLETFWPWGIATGDFDNDG